jgi:hypothetical protein
MGNKGGDELLLRCDLVDEASTFFLHGGRRLGRGWW